MKNFSVLCKNFKEKYLKYFNTVISLNPSAFDLNEVSTCDIELLEFYSSIHISNEQTGFMLGRGTRECIFNNDKLF